jgi:hypothetical protein
MRRLLGTNCEREQCPAGTLRVLSTPYLAWVMENQVGSLKPVSWRASRGWHRCPHRIAERQLHWPRASQLQHRRPNLLRRAVDIDCEPLELSFFPLKHRVGRARMSASDEATQIPVPLASVERLFGKVWNVAPYIKSPSPRTPACGEGLQYPSTQCGSECNKGRIQWTDGSRTADRRSTAKVRLSPEER